MAFSTNSMAPRHLESIMFLKFGEDFEWPKFPKLRLLRRPNFLKIFSFCVQLGCSSRGRTPAALRSLLRPRLGGQASPRGPRGPGCAGQQGLWPRRRIWGKPHEAWDRCEGKWMNMLMVQVFLRSWLHPFLDLDFVLEKRILRLEFLLSKGSYRVMFGRAITIQKLFQSFRSFHYDVNSCDSCISAGLMPRTEVFFSCHS